MQNLLLWVDGMLCSTEITSLSLCYWP